MITLIAGMQRIHNTCSKPATWAESNTAHRTEGNWANGQHNQKKIHCYRNAAETEHLRSRYDPQI